MSTLHDWNAQGLSDQQGAAFAQDMMHIQALKVFVATLPFWCDKHNTGVVVQLSSEPNAGGVGLELAFSRPTLPVGSAQELVDLLKERNHLMELELVIEKMRGLGVRPDVIDVLVDEANKLAEKIQKTLT